MYTRGILHVFLDFLGLVLVLYFMFVNVVCLRVMFLCVVCLILQNVESRIKNRLQSQPLKSILTTTNRWQTTLKTNRQDKSQPWKPRPAPPSSPAPPKSPDQNIKTTPSNTHVHTWYFTCIFGISGVGSCVVFYVCKCCVCCKWCFCVWFVFDTTKCRVQNQE